MLPLDNIRVLDMTGLAPGPFCSMVLGDLGADVLLVEPPASVRPEGLPVPGLAPERAIAFNALRRNKRSIVLDLKQEAAREVVYRLAQDADVVMEGFRPGVAARIGVDYATLRARNPRLVYCSISGYGQDGPYRDLPGHDINYIAIAGVLGLIGSADGQPAIPYNFIADFASGGLLSAVAILTALWARERTGEGQYLDMSLTDGSLYLLASAMGRFLASGELPRPGRERLNGGYPDYQAYRCADGRYLAIGALEQKFWVNLCRALGREELVGLRSERPDDVIQELRAVFATRPRDEWFEELRRVDTCVGKVNQLDEVARDPQVQARGMMVEVPGPSGEAVPMVAVAAHLRGTPGAIRSVGPLPGAHTVEVLEGLGYSAKEIEGLRAAGAVATA